MMQWSQPEPYSYAGRVGTLSEHLGYSATEKLLICNADDFGLTEGVNRTALELYADGVVSSTTIMMTGAAIASGIELLRGSGLDCGVHLTLTSSLQHRPAKPVSDASQVKSLLNEHGEFYYDRNEYFEHALPSEAILEASAQIEAAFDTGLEISHIDSHEGTLQLKPAFAAAYVELARQHALPIRMGSRALLHQLGLPADWIEKLRSSGLHFPDNLVYTPIDSFNSLEQRTAFVVGLLQSLPTGVTELFFHPLNPDYLNSDGLVQDEITRFRVWDYQILRSKAYTDAVAASGAQLISFAPLRELCRRGAAS